MVYLLCLSVFACWQLWLAARNVCILVALMTNGLFTRHYLTGFELTNFEHKN